MGLILLACLAQILPLNLVPPGPTTPDDDAVYQQAEDRLQNAARTGRPDRPRIQTRLLLRAHADSLTGMTPVATFARALFRHSDWQGCMLLEKDAGEASIVDFLGGGLSRQSRRWNLVLGDYAAFFGRGLVLASPTIRSGLPNASATGSVIAIPGSAIEGRNLRGAGVELTPSPALRISLLGSCACRDAKLNEDGTVVHLRTSGRHDDSASLAERNQVGQLVAGLSLWYRPASWLHLGAHTQGMRFTRTLAPTESATSYYGRDLGAASVSTEIAGERARCRLELAHSLPGGGAASIEVGSRSRGIDALAFATACQSRFFAPLGRNSALTGCRSRVEAGFRFHWKLEPLQFGISGSTRRDYLTDSLPGNVQASATWRRSSGGIRVVLGWNYRLAEERSRTARLELRSKMGPLRINALLADEYPECTNARGRMAALAASTSLSLFELAATMAWVDIQGNGIRMSVPEVGPARVGSYYGTSRSALRFSFAAAILLKELGRVGFKAGIARTDRWLTDLGLQVELGYER